MNQIWPEISELNRAVPLPNGFILDQLSRDEIASLIDSLEIWYPTIQTGSESVHLKKKFYEQQTFLKGEDDTKDIFPYTIKRGTQILGMFSLQRDQQALSLFGRLGAVDPQARGYGLAAKVPQLMIEIGLRLPAGVVYSFATLTHPYSQKAYESAGFKAVGIVPAFDIDCFPEMGNRRVAEVIYVKVLSSPEELVNPVATMMTDEVKTLWNHLFPDHLL